MCKAMCLLLWATGESCESVKACSCCQRSYRHQHILQDEPGFCSAWQVVRSLLSMFWTVTGKDYFGRWRAFQTLLWREMNWGTLKCAPPLTVAISQEGSTPLGIWHRAPPSCPPRGLGTMREHWVPLSGVLFCCYSSSLISTGSHQEKLWKLQAPDLVI